MNYLWCVLFVSDFDFIAFHLPVSSNEVDMCTISEELTDPNVDLLSIEPNHCAAQLTAMDAVRVDSFLFVFCF